MDCSSLWQAMLLAEGGPGWCGARMSCYQYAVYVESGPMNKCEVNRKMKSLKGWRIGTEQKQAAWAAFEKPAPCITNCIRFFTLIHKGVLLRPLGTDLISPALQLCMTVICGLITAKYHRRTRVNKTQLRFWVNTHLGSFSLWFQLMSCSVEDDRSQCDWHIQTACTYIFKPIIGLIRSMNWSQCVISLEAGAVCVCVKEEVVHFLKLQSQLYQSLNLALNSKTPLSEVSQPALQQSW